MSRFKVATCSGYSFTLRGQGGPSKPGLTASVLDTRHCHREVKRFRSEERLRVWGTRQLGVEGAKQKAQEYADKLNARCERT